MTHRELLLDFCHFINREYLQLASPLNLGTEMVDVYFEYRETELGRLFEANSDCYADTTDGSVVKAMTKAKFIEIASILIT